MIEVYSQNLKGIWFGVACAQQQIFASSFSSNQQTTLSNILAAIPYNTPFQVLHEPSPFAKNNLDSLKKIYDGTENRVSFPIAYSHLPIYTQKVLKTTSQIPIGYLTSYGSIAQVVGGGPRAVGNIMASNPFVPIIPCHRVVKSDFSLGGYGRGIQIKLDFLNREKRGFSNSKEIQVNERSLTVFPVEFVLSNFNLT